MVMALIPASSLGTPALASEHRITADVISDALRAQDYKISSIRRTLLGRITVVARNDLVWREVVLDVSSGQILRDYAIEFDVENAPSDERHMMPRGGKIITELRAPDARAVAHP